MTRAVKIRPTAASLLMSQRYIASATQRLLEKQTVNVPTMGDSITEGTVVEWTAQVGQKVQVDDVVAMVETDKVTVEIKAESEGVVTQQFCDVDETVEVGAPLYEIDGDAEATVEASDASMTSTTTTTTTSSEPVPVASPAPAKTAVEKKQQHRVPSIKFLGKEGWALRLRGILEPEPVYIPPNYGRPAFSEEEMEALMMGGASLAPEVKGYSYGASFQA